MTDNEEDGLHRSQKRLLRRIYNGRTVPIIADGKPFLTYKEALRHLASLPVEERDAAYETMKAAAKSAD